MLKHFLPSSSFALVIIFLLTMVQSGSAFSYTLEISESELQKKVAAMMPLKKKNMFLAVTLSEPTVNLIKQSNKIGIFTHIEVIALGNLKGSGRANITGTLDYNAEEGAFYFRNPTIVDLQVDRVEQKFVPKIQDIIQIAITKAMSVYPVYKFNDDDIKHRLAKSTLKTVIVEDEKLFVTLSLF